MQDIKKIVNYYKRKYNTSDPFEIADRLNILYQFGDLKYEGCYMFLKNHRYIILNQNLSYHYKQLLKAHELRHANLHRNQNSYYILKKTLLLNSKNEIEANKFAMELLISDEVLLEYQDCTINQVARSLGYRQNLIELRMK